MRHRLIKLIRIKDKENILKATREKQQTTYKGIPIRLSGDFSAETLQARRQWRNTFKEMKKKTYDIEYSTTEQDFLSDLSSNHKIKRREEKRTTETNPRQLTKWE